MITSLPLEVIVQVSHHIDQYDVVNLALTCLEMNRLMIPQLYKTINIDSSPKNYSQTLLHEPINRTTVRSIFSLKKLFRNLICNQWYCKQVNTFITSTKIPDLSDMELQLYLNQILPLLENLTVFRWRSDTCKIATHLPRNYNLKTIDGNFDFTNLPKVIDTNKIMNLKYLRLTHVYTYHDLESIDVMQFQNLEYLSISMKNLVKDCREDYLQRLFNHDSNVKLQLKELKFENMIVRPSDATLLGTNITLKKLTKLEIINCHEIWWQTEGDSSRRHPHEKTFLEILCSNTINVQCININCSNELSDNSYQIEALKNIKNLTKIELYLNFNWKNHLTRNNTNVYFEKLFIDLIDLILKFKLTLSSLQINFEISETKNLNCTIPCCLSRKKLPAEFFKKLENFSNLELLSIPINESLITQIYDITSNLTNLRVLDFSAITDKESSKGKCLINSAYFKVPLSTTYNIGDFSTLSGNLPFHYRTFAEGFRKCTPSLQIVRFPNALFYCGEKVELWENLDLQCITDWLGKT